MSSELRFVCLFLLVISNLSFCRCIPCNSSVFSRNFTYSQAIPLTILFATLLLAVGVAVGVVVGVICKFLSSTILLLPSFATLYFHSE